jgi:peroxidase
LYAGGLSETSKSEQQPVGQRFACIIMKQFRDLKNGDRFYYENSRDININAFTPAQLREIKKVSLAGVMCNNYDLSKLQKNVFINAQAIGYLKL